MAEVQEKGEENRTHKIKEGRDKTQVQRPGDCLVTNLKSINYGQFISLQRKKLFHALRVP